MSSVKTKDVSDFIKDMIEQTMVYETDEAGYVIRKSNGERITINDGGVQVPLIIYQETVSDQNAQTINPLAEGLGSTPSSLWFYDTLKTALLGRIFTLVISVIQTALDEKKAKADQELHIPMQLLNVSSLIIEDVDDRVLEEFMPLTEDKATNEFITIYYQRKQLKSVLRCGLFDAENTGIPAWKSKFPKVRKKTWVALEKTMLGILNIKDKDDIVKFSKKADEISCARLSSFLNVLMGVYQEINTLLDIINPDIAVDLSKLAHHITNLSAYADNAKFMVQTNRGGAIPMGTQPATIPGMVSNIPLPQQAYPQPMLNQPGASLIPGPMYADGRPSQPVLAQPAYQPQGMFPQQPPMFPQQGYGYPAQPPMFPQQGYDPNTIPFPGPYVTMPQQQPMLGAGGFNGINLMPGAPAGFNPRW